VGAGKFFFAKGFRSLGSGGSWRGATKHPPKLKQHDENAIGVFRRLQGDAVLSQWKPDALATDIPDIPSALRRLEGR